MYEFKFDPVKKGDVVDRDITRWAISRQFGIWADMSTGEYELIQSLILAWNEANIKIDKQFNGE